MLEIIILILSVAVNFILGLTVLLNNPQKDMNKRFFYLTLSMWVWAVITYFSLHPVGFSQITWVRLVLAAAALQDYFVLSSFAIFPNGNFHTVRFRRPAFYYLLFVMFITQTPLVFKALDENSQPIVAPGIIFFIILIFGYLGTAIYLLLKRFRRATGQMKNQLRVVIAGVVTCFAAIVFTNFFLVSVFKNTSLISFAPMLTLILTGSMAYAILRHRLFDIRLTVARAVAYLLTFSLVIVVYSAIAFLVGQIFSFNNGNSSSSQRFFYVGLAVVTAVAFQPVKRFFDKTTNRLFFKDAYEPQVLLDGISSILVGNIRLEPVLHDSSRALAKGMKLAGCSFLVFYPGSGARQISTPKFAENGVPENMISHIKSIREPLTITDDLPLSRQELKDYLYQIGCSAIIRLSTHKTRVGYLLVGHKKSGDMLNSLDVRVLGIMADELAIAIENSLRFEEISHFNVTLQERVDEATRQLRHANHRLKELDQTKDEFISMASHQLRTPLTTIKGYLSMVLEGDVGPVTKDERKMIEMAFDGAERMVFLIADLLNVSRLQSGKFVIDDKPTDLAKMVESEVTQLQDTAVHHNLKLTLHKPDKFPLLNIDDTKIRQVVMNFLDNAIYYTPAGGSIDVKLEATKGAINYTVTDTGLGVPTADQHHLFSKFYRAGNARKMRPDGTGLGLFMAKKVITAQGGAIIFNSAEGKGSTFGFSFPRNKVEIKGHTADKPKAETVRA
jgi:signal transduction histidine kinase